MVVLFAAAPDHRRHHLPCARAVQARHPLHRTGGHGAHLCRGDHRRACLGAARAAVGHQGSPALGGGDLRPDRRRPDPPLAAMGRRHAAQGRAAAPAGEFPGAQERHHLWRRHYRHPVAPRAERDRRLQHGRLHRQQPVACRPGGAWRQGAQARQDRQGDHHRECQGGAARHALGAAQRAARRDQGARALPGGGEDAARARRDRLGPCRGERLEADRGRGSARPRSGRAGARAPHRACEGQGGDDHRSRRLDRLGADPPAARAWAEGAHPVRAVGGGALRDRDGDRGEQMAPGEGA